MREEQQLKGKMRLKRESRGKIPHLIATLLESKFHYFDSGISYFIMTFMSEIINFSWGYFIKF